MFRRGVKHYVIKFVSDLRQIDGFLRTLRFPSPIKSDRQDIAEILFKEVAKHHNPNSLIAISQNGTKVTMAVH